MEIPLFPLPLVLFPQIVLPLHIFEERYRLMINRCIEDSSVFGMVLIPPGTSAENEATILRVGVTTRVFQYDRIADGRINIMAAGETRFRILQFQHHEPYWTAEVELFEDNNDENDEELQESCDTVRRLFRIVYRLAAQLRGVDVEEIPIPEAPSSLSYMVSYALEIDPGSKQALLEMTSTTGRLKALVVHLEETIQRLNVQLEHNTIIRKLKGNGHHGDPNNN